MSYVWKHKHTMLETLEAETGGLKVQDQPGKLEILFQIFFKKYVLKIGVGLPKWGQHLLL